MLCVALDDSNNEIELWLQTFFSLLIYFKKFNKINPFFLVYPIESSKFEQKIVK